MDFPADLRYSQEHEWVRVEDGVGTVGVTDYAQDQLGDIVYLDLPAIGTNVVQFEKLGEIESVKAVSDLYAPISGEVSEVNQRAIESPEMVNQEPFEGGWLLRVRLSNAAELDNLLTAAEYDAFIATEKADAG